MGGLAHYLEEEGLATTQISLIRPQTENTKPPRALWVPFELGRPMGAPNNPEFQMRVLRAALNLLDRHDGPVLIEDFPEEAPADLAASNGEGWFCPISLPPLPVKLSAGGGLKTAMEGEISSLNPWREVALREHGRTTVGLSGLSITEITDFICTFLDGDVPENPNSNYSVGQNLKFAVDDLKAFYLEAAGSQPGQSTGKQMNDWFYGETASGKALYALVPVIRNLALQRDDKFMKIFANLLLIPASQKFRAETR